MTDVVVAHGAWSAGWAWKKMRSLLRAAGHELWTPTYTGLGERAHLAIPMVDLDTHIADVAGVLDFENLRDVALIGHSYGGMVATGIADRARSRISQVIYIDAFAPKDGQSLFDLVGEEASRHMRHGAQTAGEGWRVPPMPMPPDTSPEDNEWATPLRRPQPIRAFETKLRLTGQEATLPRAYIYCKRARPGDVFRQFADRAQREGWRYFEMDASHNPHITVPGQLRDILVELLGSRN